MVQCTQMTSCSIEIVISQLRKRRLNSNFLICMRERRIVKHTSVSNSTKFARNNSCNQYMTMGEEHASIMFVSTIA